MFACLSSCSGIFRSYKEMPVEGCNIYGLWTVQGFCRDTLLWQGGLGFCGLVRRTPLIKSSVTTSKEYWGLRHYLKITEEEDTNFHNFLKKCNSYEVIHMFICLPVTVHYMYMWRSGLERVRIPVGTDLSRKNR